MRGILGIRVGITHVLVVLALTAFAKVATAAPSASCAANFIGSWQITVLATGQTYVGEYRANGAAISHCPLCSPGTWTCSGNTVTVYVNGIVVTGQLSGDRMRLTAGCCVSRRIGRPPSAPATTVAEKTAPSPAAPKQQQPSQRSQGSQGSCSDITGTGGAPSQRPCPPAKSAQAAQPKPQPSTASKGVAAPAPGVQQAQGATSEPAALAGKIVDELGRVRAGQAASSPPPQPQIPAAAAPSGLAVAGVAAGAAAIVQAQGEAPVAPTARSCVPYFENMMENFKRSALTCLRDTRLMLSLTDMASSKDVDPGGDVYLDQDKAKELVGYIDPIDPRWQFAGGKVRPICTLPMTVAAQNESFSECARVYLCGLKAAACGLGQAQRSATDQCIPISRACLAENPIPQRMTEAPKPPQYRQPEQPAPLPSPPANRSTITGPSGRGGGGGSGTVRSAQ